MSSRLARNTAAAAVAVAGLAALPGVAAGDAVYHTQHMALTPVGDAPLRSGHVQNIKANGPTIYAHEIYVLNGAARRATYTVTNHFFFEDSTCSDPANDFPSDTAELRTNRSGNDKAQFVFVPADVAGFEGVHGVMWTIQNSDGEVVYQTGCSRVTLDYPVTRGGAPTWGAPRWPCGSAAGGRAARSRTRASPRAAAG